MIHQSSVYLPLLTMKLLLSLLGLCVSVMAKPKALELSANPREVSQAPSRAFSLFHIYLKRPFSKVF